MTRSPIGSPMLRARAALLHELPNDAWFDVAMMQKDLRIALDVARAVGVPLPSTMVADEMLSISRAAGYEHSDIAVLFRTLRAGSHANRSTACRGDGVKSAVEGVSEIFAGSTRPTHRAAARNDSATRRDRV